MTTSFIRHLFLGLTFSSIFSFGQTSDKATEYYLAGNDALALKKYSLADSLYSLSIATKPHPDTYYNRAMLKRHLKDMKGYCIDLGNAANLRDTIALREFWRDCGKVDTTYFDKKNNPATKQSYESYAISQGCIYTSDLKYFKYERPKKLIVRFEVKNNDTIFFECPNYPTYPGGESQVVENIKYISPPKEERNGRKQAIVIVGYTIQKDGSVDNIMVSAIGYSKTYMDTIGEAFKKYTKKWRPAEYNGQKVKFRKVATFVVDFK